MKNPEKLDNQFLAAARSVQEANGGEWFYVGDVAKEIVFSDESFVRRRELGNKILGVFGLRLSDNPIKLAFVHADMPSVVSRLRSNNLVESEWEVPDLYSNSLPRRMMYRLTGNEE
jgi:hypothetical protein